MIGQTVSHYRILSKLGQGGMGEVYLAEDIRLGHKVAIKRLSEHLVADRTLRQRFEREARAVAHLTHPNILTLLEFDEVDSNLILVTEYLPGGNLHDVIQDHPDGVELSLFFRWATQAADALAMAHSQDVLHRDIKPANLLLTEAGDLRVADFGLTQFAAETQITQPGAVMGTLAYMAPEQHRGERVDAKADIFSLGATFRELLVGRSDGGGVMMHAMVGVHPGVLTDRRPDLPSELEQLILEMLAGDPNHRMSSATEVGDRLRGIAVSLGFSADLPSRVVAKRRSPRRAWLAAALVLLVIVAWYTQQSWFSKPDAAQVGRHSVAVLPLRDVSPDGPQEYLAAGITEALMVDLSRIRSLSVISRRSSEQLAESDLSMTEIAQRLDADVVFDGSVTRIGNHIKVTATLVDGDSDRNIWVSDFEGELQDVFSLQREIALAVARGMGVETAASSEMALQSPRTVDPQAMERYLQARQLWKQRSAESLMASAAIFQELVTADPYFAEAWLGLAAVQIVLPSYTEQTLRKSYPDARRSAERALESDPSIAEAWNILSEIAYIYDLDYEESERLRLKSLDQNPSSATTHQWYAEFLGGMGRHEQALEEIRIAQRLDPLSPLMKTVEGQVLIYARRFEDAVEVLQQVLVSHPDFVLARGYLAMALQYAGRMEEAAQAFIDWQRVLGTDPQRIRELEEAIEREGYMGVKRILLEQNLRLLQDGEFVKARSMAAGYAELEDVENSLLWLEQSIRDRDIALLRLKINPEFDAMRDDPRFIEIMRRIGLGG